MSHDPMCPDPTDGWDSNCRCAEYARVREDERAKFSGDVKVAEGVNYAIGYADGHLSGRNSGYDKAYAAGYAQRGKDDADAVAALTVDEDGWDQFDDAVNEALAAIAALDGDA